MQSAIKHLKRAIVLFVIGLAISILTGAHNSIWSYVSIVTSLLITVFLYLFMRKKAQKHKAEQNVSHIMPLSATMRMLINISPVVGAIILILTFVFMFEWYFSLPLSIAVCLFLMPILVRQAFTNKSGVDCDRNHAPKIPVDTESPTQE